MKSFFQFFILAPRLEPLTLPDFTHLLPQAIDL